MSIDWPPSVPGAIWGEWFGSYATNAAAKRYLTMQFTGPNVPDRDDWVATATRLGPDGRWQVRLAYYPPVNILTLQEGD